MSDPAAPSKLSKTEKTHQSLLQAAAILLSKQPDATLNDIAVQAGVGRATLHRHFKNRDDLMHQLAMNALDSVNAICKPAIDNAENALAALEAIVDELVPLGDQYRFLASTPLTYTDPDVKGRYDRHLYRLSELAEQLKEEKVMDRQIPTVWIVAVIDALVYAAWFSVEDGYLARRDAPSLALRTLLKGLS